MTSTTSDLSVTPDFDLAAFENKERTRFMDPCAKQSQASFRCLEENFGDRDKCMDYFQAYRDCKKIWLEARREARRRRNSGAS